MKNLLCCIVGILLAMASATASAAQSSGKTGRDEDAVRGKLIGAWRLAWIEEEAADGKLA